MKTHIKIAAIAIMLCLTGQLFAQHEKEIKNSEVEGLYLTLSDFKNGKLTRPTDIRITSYNVCYTKLLRQKYC